MLKVQLTTLLIIISIKFLIAQQPVSSWIANTNVTQSDHIIPNTFDLHVLPDGTVYAIQPFNEAGHDVCIFKDGRKTGYFTNADGSIFGGGNYRRVGGAAITHDDTYIYITMHAEGQSNWVAQGIKRFPPDGFTWQCIRRFKRSDGKAAPYPNGYLPDASALKIQQHATTGGRVNRLSGLLHLNGELFVSCPGPGFDSIKVYNASSGAYKRGWKFTKPFSIDVAKDGTLWVLQKNNGDQLPRIIHLDTNGNELPGSFALEAGIDPQVMNIDNQGRILIADNGPDQNIKIYAGLDATPSLAGAFGIKGGVYSGSPNEKGTVGELRFRGPVAADTDENGNIYIACNGQGAVIHDIANNDHGLGLTIEMYTPSGMRQWILRGLVFVDNADANPDDETEVYTCMHKFKMDYAQSPGKQWQHVATTIDPFSFPADIRWNIDNTHRGIPQVVKIQGKKFLFMVDMNSNFLSVYRFEPEKYGEIAIPCGIFNRELAKHPYLHEKPTTSGDWIWIDSNGDGNAQINEYSVTGTSANGPERWGYHVDKNGDVWVAIKGTGGIRKFKFQGINSIGAPVYNYSNVEIIPTPEPFKDLRRIEYNSETDEMYLSGWTTLVPYDGNWKGPGRVIVKYKNWSLGKRTPLYTFAIPNNIGPQNKALPTCLDVEADYIFIGYYNFQKKPVTQVYKSSDGSFVAEWMPSFAENGLEGDFDTPTGIKAHKRKNGQYLVFCEYDIVNKVMMYQWEPSIPNKINQTTQPSSQMKIYPNPLGESDLKVVAPLIKTEAQIAVYNSVGNKIYQNYFSGNMIDIPGRLFTPGMYVVSIISQKEKLQSIFTKE